MARLFADSFDMYAAAGDLLLGRWTALVGVANQSLVSANNTAFNYGQALRLGFAGQVNAGLQAIFETATNESTVYFSLRFRNTNATLATHGVFLTLRDSTNAQVTVGWRGDGSIVAYSGANGGTLLTTLNAAFSANTWDSYQGKIVIHNTTGSVEIRKNGSTTPIINLTNVNTRAGSANNYVNQFILVSGTISAPTLDLDDVWLNSDNGAAPTSWPGDVRCFTSMVASDSSVVFARSPSPTTITPFTTNSSASHTTGTGRMAPFTATYTGTISSVILSVAAGGTGNLKCAIYDNIRAAVLATSNVVVNPTAGATTITFGTPLAVTKGTTYHFAADADFTISYSTNTSNTAGFNFTTAYASFPASGPSTIGGQNPLGFTINLVPTLNTEFVYEPIQDSDTSYVYSSTVAQEDKYGIAPLTFATPSSILGVAPFVMWKKTDSGTRTGTLSVTAHGSADTAQVSGFAPSLSYTYSQKFMPLDPTGAAWTLPFVTSMLIGVTVAS